MSTSERANSLFKAAESLFFQAKFKEALFLLEESNQILNSLHQTNFFNFNIDRMQSVFDAPLPKLSYISRNEKDIRLLLSWIALNNIKPKYQLLEYIKENPIEWPEWDEEILPSLGKRVHIEKRRASDLLAYLLKYANRQFILDDIKSRKRTDLITYINDPQGIHNRIYNSNIVTCELLPPYSATCLCYVHTLSRSSIMSSDKSKFGDIIESL